MNRKITRFILPLLIILMVTQNIAVSANFTDLEQSKYKKEIEELVDANIINGYTDSTFKPEANITRAEFSKLLAVSLKLERTSQAAIKFLDVVGKWHEGYIEAVYENGLMIGTSDTTFNPDSNITREELALVLVRAFDLVDPNQELSIEVDIQDRAEISSWAVSSVEVANYIGLMSGIDNDYSQLFSPKSYGDRQLVSKLIYELLFNRIKYELKIQELIDATKDINSNNNSNDSAGGVLPNEPNIVLEDIISKYKNKLSTLEGKTESKLDSLIAQAMSEYKDGKALSELYDEYQDIGKQLEISTDNAVLLIISDMKQELIYNGYDTSTASELYNEYEEIKANQNINIKL